MSYLFPLLVFTDGCYEPGQGAQRAGLGGVLLNPSDQTFSYFSAYLDDAATSILEADSANPIAAIELMAVLLASLLWNKFLQNRAVLYFVDNDAAKHGLARGSSSSEVLAAIIDATCEVEIRTQRPGLL